MNFEKLARDDYDPSRYASPEDALLEELGNFTEASHARGMADYFGLGEEQEAPVSEECAACAEGSCMEHMDAKEAEALASLPVGD